jgi:hypothetical protein
MSRKFYSAHELAALSAAVGTTQGKAIGAAQRRAMLAWSRARRPRATYEIRVAYVEVAAGDGARVVSWSPEYGDRAGTTAELDFARALVRDGAVAPDETVAVVVRVIALGIATEVERHVIRNVPPSRRTG